MARRPSPPFDPDGRNRRVGRGGATIGLRASAQIDACGLTAVARPLYSAGFATPASRGLNVRNAPVAELVDALDSKSSSARSAGSIPARGTTGSSATNRTAV